MLSGLGHCELLLVLLLRSHVALTREIGGRVLSLGSEVRSHLGRRLLLLALLVGHRLLGPLLLALRGVLPLLLLLWLLLFYHGRSVHLLLILIGLALGRCRIVVLHLLLGLGLLLLLLLWLRLHLVLLGLGLLLWGRLPALLPQALIVLLLVYDLVRLLLLGKVLLLLGLLRVVNGQLGFGLQRGGTRRLGGGARCLILQEINAIWRLSVHDLGVADRYGLHFI